ncbi:MAG TPA: hypothetical protein VMZ31_02755 [Phycisphaerae bacterium]|nr:hypothetical protein [Phycisphaerae bacterium]
MRTATCMLAAVILTTTTGCFTAAKRGLAEVAGAKGELQVLGPLSPDNVANAGGVQAGTVDNDAGPNCPPNFVGELKLALIEELAENAEKVAYGGGAKLQVNTRVLYYRGGGGMEKLLGSMSLALARIEVIDTGSGAVIGRSNVVGSTKAIRSSPEDLAKAIAKEVAEWLREQAIKPPKQDQ